MTLSNQSDRFVINENFLYHKIKTIIDQSRSQMREQIDEMLKLDPRFLDFLTEPDFKTLILEDVKHFLLESGSDFAFIDRQKRIQVGGHDYYIDLLFYHRKLKRLVLIELKLDEFEPAHKGQVELYLKWLSKYEKEPGEEEPIALILCAGKDAELVELMDLERDNIHVAEYWLQLPPKDVLQAKLRLAIAQAQARIEAQGSEML